MNREKMLKQVLEGAKHEYDFILLDCTYIVRVHFSETAKETMEDKIKRMLREEVRKM